MGHRAHKRVSRGRTAAAPAAPASAPGAEGVRTAYGLSRERFARLAGYSARAIASWESGAQAPGDAARMRLAELDRLRQALGRVLRGAALADWLDLPNRSFDGLKPLEVVERGQIDRLWRMIFLLESGQAA